MGNKIRLIRAFERCSVYWQCGQRIVVVHPEVLEQRIEDGQCACSRQHLMRMVLRLYWSRCDFSNAYYLCVRGSSASGYLAVSSWFYALISYIRGT